MSRPRDPTTENSLLIGVCVFLKLIKQKIGGDKVCLSFFVVMVAITFALDNFNGSTFASDNHRSFNLYDISKAAPRNIMATNNSIQEI